MNEREIADAATFLAAARRSGRPGARFYVAGSEDVNA